MKTLTEIETESGKKHHHIRNALNHLKLQPDKRIGPIRLYGPEKEKAILDYMAVDHRAKEGEKC